jgi:hypothetical protein
LSAAASVTVLYFARGAFAIVEGDMGTETPDELAAPAAAKFAADGDVAGARPGTSMTGDACFDGNCGSAERATADESVGASFGFHQAHCGPD